MFKNGEIKFKMIYYFFGLLNRTENEKMEKNDNINKINDENNKNLNETDDIIKIEDLESYNISDLFNDNLLSNSPSYKALYSCYNELAKKDNLDIEKIEKKETITCDQAFILYLFYISKIVNKDFCLINLIVLKHFRDLVNILGWNLLSRFKSLDDEDTSKDFSSNKEPLKIPLLVNDFCNNYIKKVMKDFDVYFAFVIISHFNFWLYANDLTFIKLNLPNAINEQENKIKEKNDLKSIDNNVSEDINSSGIKNKDEN